MVMNKYAMATIIAEEGANDLCNVMHYREPTAIDSLIR